MMLLPRGDASLTEAQAAAGQTLACRARPRSDVAITWLVVAGAEQAAPLPT